nr:MAG TPA: hypothetical protein [Bacteriophage sp.]
MIGGIYQLFLADKPINQHPIFNVFVYSTVERLFCMTILIKEHSSIFNRYCLMI